VHQSRIYTGHGKYIYNAYDWVYNHVTAKVNQPIT
jgi:hypothetical protein